MYKPALEFGICISGIIKLSKATAESSISSIPPGAPSFGFVSGSNSAMLERNIPSLSAIEVFCNVGAKLTRLSDIDFLASAVC